MIFISILLLTLSYFYGCFSTARILTKSARSLNIYKVGSGFADTENIYSNVSKPLGVLVGALDVVKSYAYLYFMKTVLIFFDKMQTPSDLSMLYSDNMMMLYGLMMLVGHCLPLTNKLRGGRGIFTYMGFILFMSFFPMLITMLLALLVVFIFRQIRFAQYIIVLLPMVFTQLLDALNKFIPLIPVHNLGAAFSSKLLGLAIAMGILNFIVSKKLGEF